MTDKARQVVARFLRWLAEGIHERDAIGEIRGRVSWELRDVTTGKVECGEVTNLIVDQGRTYLQQNMQNDSPVNPGYIHLSTSATAVAAGEVTVPATLLGYKAVTKSRPSVTTCRMACTFLTTEGNGTVASIGIASAIDGTGEFCRTVLGATITKDATKELTVNYDWTITW